MKRIIKVKKIPLWSKFIELFHTRTYITNSNIQKQMELELTTNGSQSQLSFETVGKQLLKQTYMVHLTKEDDGYVISCPELNATTQGDTEQEAYRNIIEAMELVLETERKDTNFNIDLRKK